VLAFRTRGGANDSGWTTRVIPAKFPALRVEGAPNRKAEGLYDKMNGTGAHEMIIESPEHNHTLASAPLKRVEDLFWAFRDRVLDLRRDVRLRYILLFKNHGESAGAAPPRAGGWPTAANRTPAPRTA
jgi:UDPglucose--hexose-1-phosphate uridylyltransferase